MLILRNYRELSDSVWSYCAWKDHHFPIQKITVNVPRDRDGEFDPKVVPKNESRLSDEIAEVIIGLYSKGMSTTDIEQQIEQIYSVQVDSTSVSKIGA